MSRSSADARVKRAVRPRATDRGCPTLAVLMESQSIGLHRVLLDSADSTYIVLKFRPKGRRRFRLDLACKRESDLVMVGRAHIAAMRVPSAEIAMGELDCRFTLLADGWLEAMVQSRGSFSHVNITLMREDGAVAYRGDGRSAIEFSGIRVLAERS